MEVDFSAVVEVAQHLDLVLYHRECLLSVQSQELCNAMVGCLDLERCPLL